MRALFPFLNHLVCLEEIWHSLTKNVFFYKLYKTDPSEYTLKTPLFRVLEKPKFFSFLPQIQKCKQPWTKGCISASELTVCSLSHPIGGLTVFYIKTVVSYAEGKDNAVFQNVQNYQLRDLCFQLKTECVQHESLSPMLSTKENGFYFLFTVLLK